MKITLKAWQRSGLFQAFCEVTGDEGVRRRAWQVLDILEPSEEEAEQLGWVQEDVANRTFVRVSMESINEECQVEVPDTLIDFFLDRGIGWQGWNASPPTRRFLQHLESLRPGREMAEALPQ